MATNDGSNDTSLEEISNALQVLHLHAANPSEASNALSILASSSRTDRTTRQSLTEPDILRALIVVIDCNLSDSIEIVESALRCVGNACIDNDAAREHITDLGFNWVLRCLRSHHDNDGSISALTIKVLYNICTDYDPARERCFNDKVHYALVDYSTSSAARSAEGTSIAGLFVELLFWVCCQVPSESDAETLPKETLRMLLSMPILYEPLVPIEEWAMLLETCLTFLRDAEIQKQVVEQELVGAVWDALGINEAKIETLDLVDPEQSESDKKLLVPISTSMIWCLSDIATLPEFANATVLESSQLGQVVLLTLCEAAAQTRVLVAACQMLGNVLWSVQNPGITQNLVKSKQIHEPILTMLKDSEDKELLHSAAGLLIQLLRPSNDAREIIGRDERCRQAVERLYRHEMPQLKQDGIVLLRALGKDCPENQERFADLAKEVMEAASANDQTMPEAPT